MDKKKAEKGHRNGNESPKNEGETEKPKAEKGEANENTQNGDQISDAKKGVRKDFKNKLHIGENATPLRLKAKKEVFKNTTPKRGKAVEKGVKELHVSEIAKV
ncbi:hypothetical protein niasHS_000068 [Heterodera schachtii]|uniref:Uncharacterized protein n=1 Tax=Heterodera schachtii TaxID=97005 RepID=A0ABD2KMC2_HETSC